MCRESPPGHVFVGSLAEIDPRTVQPVAELLCPKIWGLCPPDPNVEPPLRRSGAWGQKNRKTPLRPFFRALSETQRDFRP